MGMYVIQVVGGRELNAVDVVNRAAHDVCEECFAPRVEVMRKKRGEWVRVYERLFPGYVFVETSTPEVVAERLRSVPLFTRLLCAAGDRFIPLAPEEVVWIQAHVDAQTHVMDMSQGVIEGDRVVVTQGPLRGKEARITKIDRHRRLAWMDMHMFGRSKSIRVGLEIVAKRSEPTGS